MKSWSLALVEEAAKGKPIVSLLIHYRGREAPVRYTWENRSQVRWDNVVRCRLDFRDSKSYLVNGDARTVPGFRVKLR